MKLLGSKVQSIKKKIQQTKDHQEFLIEETRTTYFSEQKLSIIEEVDEDRLQIDFDEKPDEETTALLKKNGWKWSHTHQLWQRFLNENSYYNLEYILKISLDEIKAKHANRPPIEEDILDSNEDPEIRAFEEPEEISPVVNDSAGLTDWDVEQEEASPGFR